MEKFKKSVVDLTDLALGILVLGIVVSIGATIMISMRNSQITDAATASISLEAVTPTDTGVNLARVWGKTITSCQNASGGATIPAVNYSYTVNPNNGVITLKNYTSVFTSWKCNYTIYNTSDPRYSLPDNASIGLAEYGSWFKIIVIVGIAAIIISLIMMTFGKKGGETASY